MTPDKQAEILADWHDDLATGRVFVESAAHARCVATLNATRLTESQVRAIRQSKDPLAVTAERYGISISYVSSIRRRLRRRDVADA